MKRDLHDQKDAQPLADGWISAPIERLELKFSADQPGRFSGYGAVFGNVDSHGDVIQPGAFKASLAEWKLRDRLPPMLLQHGGFFGSVDDMLPIGKWTSMEENAKGLKVVGQLFALDTERGRYIHEGLREGVLDGLSIGYRARKFTMGTKPSEARRTLQDVDLRELSIVLFPSNDRARIGQAKADLASAMTDPRRFERTLRAIGFTKKFSRTVTARGFKAAVAARASETDRRAEVRRALQAAVKTLKETL